MTEEIRVLIADDQRVVREGLATLLGLLPGVTVVGAVGDGEQAVSNALELAPDVVLMDLRMPRCDGVEATRRLLASNPEAKVLVLTTYADDRSVVEALRAGAQGYLTKDAGAEDIHRSLQQVVRGQAAIDPAVQHHLVQAVAGRSPASGTARTRCSSGATAPPRGRRSGGWSSAAGSPLPHTEWRRG